MLIAAELGLPGILGAGVIAFATIRVLRAVGRSRPDRAAAAALVAFLVLSMLDHYLWTMPPGRVIAWLPFALLGATPRLQLTNRLR